MILDMDGRDKLWEEGVHWEHEDGYHDTGTDEDWRHMHFVVDEVRFDRRILDFSSMSRRYLATPADSDADEDPVFNEFRSKLIDHYFWQHKHNNIEWLN